MPGPTARRALRQLLLDASRQTAAGSGASAITELTGEVTATGPGSAAATIATDAVTYAKMQNVSAASRLLGRGSAGGAGNVEELTLGTNLSLSGTTLNATGGGISDGDKGDITVSESGATWTIDNGAVTLAKMADMATDSFLGRDTAGAGAPEVLSAATAKAILAIAAGDVSGLGTLATQSGTFSGTSSGTNTGDQTSIVGITGTKAQFDTAVTDGNFLYVGDVTQYTDEAAQDAVGAMVDATLVYTDGTPLLQRAALTGDVTASAGSNATTIAADAVTYAKLQNASAGNVVLARAAATSGDYSEVAVGASQLLGRGSTGDVAAITLGAGLSMTGTTLASTGGATVASQAEQEAGTSTTVFTTPGRQHFHPSAAKAWVCSTQSTTTIQRGYNVASVADTATGRSTITFTTNMSDTAYTVIPNAEHNSASGTTQTYQVDNGGRAVGSYIIESWQVDGTEALTDPSAAWFSVVFGDI
jgi:hypothetical protein